MQGSKFEVEYWLRVVHNEKRTDECCRTWKYISNYIIKLKIYYVPQDQNGVWKWLIFFNFFFLEIRYFVFDFENLWYTHSLHSNTIAHQNLLFFFFRDLGTFFNPHVKLPLGKKPQYWPNGCSGDQNILGQKFTRGTHSWRQKSKKSVTWVRHGNTRTLLKKTHRIYPFGSPQHHGSQHIFEYWFF